MKRRVHIALTLALVIVGLSFAIKYKTDYQNKDKKPLVAIEIATSTDNPWIDNSDIKSKLDTILKTPTENTSTEPSKNKDIIPTTATDRLAQELFIKYVEISKAGVAIDSDISAKLAESLLSKDYTEPEKLYSTANIKVQTDISPSGLRKYGNNLGLILTTPATGYQSEIEIFAKIANEPVDRYVEDLNAQKTRYLSMQAKLLALPAPQQMNRAQVDIINALTLFINAIDGALAIETDPVGAVTKLGSYDNGLSLLTNALDEYKKYFISKGITFTSTESGSLLLE